MPSRAVRPLEQLPTGIRGFDALCGGLPRGRTTLIRGGPGTGKTLLSLEILSRVAPSEPGILVAMEESSERLLANAAAFGWDLPAMVDGGRLRLLDARVPAEVVHSGRYDLSGLVAALDAARQDSGARLVVFDGIDVLLQALSDPVLVRQEVYRLHHWLSENALTAVFTSKASGSPPALPERFSFMEFMADAIVTLNQRLVGRVAERSIRVEKYRGVEHSADEHPFVIGPDGLALDLVEREMVHPVSWERVSTGVAALDGMLRGGYLRGGSILVSGAPGTAKSTLAGAFAEAACRRGEPTLYVSFDESPAEVVRNLSSVGIDLGRFVEAGLLQQLSTRGRHLGAQGLVHRVASLARSTGARCLVIDPLSVLSERVVSGLGAEAALRLVEFAKCEGITTLCTTLVDGPEATTEATAAGISTTADIWLHLSYVVQSGERNRALTVVKARGTGHSNQVRELVLSDDGVSLAEVYTAGGAVLMGTLRWQREEQERRERAEAMRERQRREGAVQREMAELQARMEALRSQLADREDELSRLQVEEVEESSRDAAFVHTVRMLRGGSNRPPYGGAANRVPADEETR